MTRVAALCASLSFVLTSMSAGAPEAPTAVRFTFFDAGKPLCEIVAPARPEPQEAEAAELLRGVFAEMGGVQVPVVTSPTPGAALHVHVGATPFARQAAAPVMPPDLDADGFAIFPADAANLVLLGGRPVSTFYAVTELLERHAGVLWAWPGEYGTVIPKTTKLSASIDTQIAAPAFQTRRFSGLGQANPRLWRLHSDKADFRHYFSHNTAKVLNPKMFAQRPEYFAMTNGKRHALDRRWQACTTNPDVIRLFVEAAKAQFRRKDQQHVISFSVSPNDGGVEEFCQCPSCRALDVPGQEGVSDRYFTFVNAVADGVREEFPDKLIACMAYGAPTRNPPLKVKLRPNTLVYLVIPTLKDRRADVEAWSKAAPNLGAYFHLHGKAAPKHYPHAFAAYLRFLRGNGVRGVYAEVYPETAERMSSWAMDAPRVWMLGKLAWNPDADVDQLMDLFRARFYGPAAPAMQRYYQRCEAAWKRHAGPDDFCGPGHREYELELYTPQDMAFLRDSLAEALRLAAGDDAIRGRLKAQQTALDRVAGYYIFADMAEALAKLGNDSEAVVAEAGARAQAAAQADPAAAFGLMPREAEAALDARFDALTVSLGKNAEAFWRRAMERYPSLAPFIQPQVLAATGQTPSVAKNPGFEEAGKKTAAPAQDAEWQSVDAPGWSIWIQPNGPGRITVDRRAARSGKASLLIQGCNAGSGIQNFAVQPGDRYRVSVWTRAEGVAAGQSGASLSVQWKSEDGKWAAKPHNLTIESPADERDWHRLTLTVTAPPGVTRMVVLLGARSQGSDGKTWFDDFEAERVYPAAR